MGMGPGFGSQRRLGVGVGLGIGFALGFGFALGSGFALGLEFALGLGFALTWMPKRSERSATTKLWCRYRPG